MILSLYNDYWANSRTTLKQKEKGRVVYTSNRKDYAVNKRWIKKIKHSGCLETTFLDRDIYIWPETAACHANLPRGRWHSFVDSGGGYQRSPLFLSALPGVVRCVVHEELGARRVVRRGGLQCSWVQEHWGLVNGSFSRNNCCRSWKCVGGRGQA